MYVGLEVSTGFSRAMDESTFYTFIGGTQIDGLIDNKIYDKKIAFNKQGN